MKERFIHVIISIAQWALLLLPTPFFFLLPASFIRDLQGAALGLVLGVWTVGGIWLMNKIIYIASGRYWLDELI